MSTIICRLACPGLSCRGSAGQGGAARRESSGATRHGNGCCNGEKRTRKDQGAFGSRRGGAARRSFAGAPCARAGRYGCGVARRQDRARGVHGRPGPRLCDRAMSAIGAPGPTLRPAGGLSDRPQPRDRLDCWQQIHSWRSFDRVSLLIGSLMHIRPIRNDQDHRAALAEIDACWGAPEGTEKGDKLEVLVALVESYEARRWPIEGDVSFDPIDTLQYAIDELGHSQAELAELLGARSRASEILARRRALTVDMIHKISEAWKIPADLLVRPYEIEHAA